MRVIVKSAHSHNLMTDLMHLKSGSYVTDELIKTTLMTIKAVVNRKRRSTCTHGIG